VGFLARVKVRITGPAGTSRGTSIVSHAGIAGKTQGKNRNEVFYFQKPGNGGVY